MWGMDAGICHGTVSSHIAVFPMVVGAGAAGICRSVAALGSMHRMMAAQNIRLGGKCHHREILHQHTQAEQNTQQFFCSLVHFHCCILLLEFRRFCKKLQ